MKKRHNFGKNISNIFVDPTTIFFCYAILVSIIHMFEKEKIIKYSKTDVLCSDNLLSVCNDPFIVLCISLSELLLCYSIREDTKTCS